MSFTKLDDGITKSSIWSEPEHIRCVWIAFLAEKDDTGFVSASFSGMRRIANLTDDDDGLKFNEAIKCLEGPDPESRTPDFDGRRIEKVDGGWIILNHEKYRLPELEKKEEHRNYMQKWREKREKCDSVNSREFTNIHSLSPSVSVSVSSSVSSLSSSNQEEDYKGKPKAEEPKTWRESFEVYQAHEFAGYDTLRNDSEWLSDRQKYHPQLNILLTLEKAHSDFWSTQGGWKNKKSSRSKEIDWKATYQNALTMKCNQVWLTKDELGEINSKLESKRNEQMLRDRGLIK